MTRRESVISASPPGAGRFNDWYFPDWTVVGAAASNGQSRARATGSITTGGGGPQNLGNYVTSQSLFYQGVCATTSNNTGAGGTGGTMSFFNACNIPIRTGVAGVLPANSYWPPDDDNNVIRVVHIGCVAALTALTNDDYGLQLICANSASAGIKRTPALGFGFQFTATGLALRTNNGGGFVDTTLLTNGVGGYQSTDYHSMEFRIFNALPTVPAFLKVLVDDVLITTVQWSSGVLPAPTGQTAVTFFPSLWINASATPNSALVTHFLGIQNAPTELMTF